MFSQKKGKADINLEEPTFYVRYAGKTETFVASGKGCTHNAVQRIWDNSVDEKYMDRMSIFINESGLAMKAMDDPKYEPLKIDIKDISYCCAEKGAHDRVFAWISKDKIKKKLFCHAVLCQNRDKAQMMAILLSQAFQVAYRDWKMKKERLARLKAKANNTCKGVQTVQSEPAVVNSGTMTGLAVNFDVARAESDASSGLSSFGGTTELAAGQFANSQFGKANSDYSEEKTFNQSEDLPKTRNVVNKSGASVGHDFPGYAFAMAQMNFVEENEISFSDSAITVNRVK